MCTVQRSGPEHGSEHECCLYLQLGLMVFCPPTSHTVRDVFLSRSRFPTLKPMVGDVSITLRWKSTTWLKSPLSHEKCLSYKEAHLSRQQSGQQSGLSSRVQTHQDHLNIQVLMFRFYSLIQGPELRILYVLCVALECSRILKRENDESSDV